MLIGEQLVKGVWKMRLYIKQIIKTLGVTEEVAKKVLFQMECSNFDFSQATNQEFAKEASRARSDCYDNVPK